MKQIITTSHDVDRGRRDAQTAGTTDGKRSTPPASSEEVTAADNRQLTNNHSAATTGHVIAGEYLDKERPEQDTEIARLASDTAKATTVVELSRLTADRSKLKAAGYEESLPESALDAGLSRRTAALLTCGLGAATGMGTVASLLSATEDTPVMSWVIGIGVAASTVLGAKVAGTLLARRDVDDRKPGKYATVSARMWTVLALALIGVTLVAFGVAGLRDRASRADAERRADATTVSGTGVLAGPASDDTASADKAPTPSSVPWYLWLALEAALVTAAIGVEYVSLNPRREHRDALRSEADNDIEDWQDGHEQLATVTGKLAAALDVRADRDASTALMLAAHDFNARALTATYRDANLTARGTAGFVFPNDETTEVAKRGEQGDAVITEFVGADVAEIVDTQAPRSYEPPKNVDPADARHILRCAYLELAQHPQVVELKQPVQAPHAGDETLLDVEAVALAKAIADRDQAANDATAGGVAQLHLWGTDGDEREAS